MFDRNSNERSSWPLRASLSASGIQDYKQCSTGMQEAALHAVQRSHPNGKEGECQAQDVHGNHLKSRSSADQESRHRKKFLLSTMRSSIFNIEGACPMTARDLTADI